MMKSQKGFAIAQAVSLQGLRKPRLQPLWRQLRRWWQLAAERRQLAHLDDAALKDMGLTRGDVYAESTRPFWDDPLQRQ